MRLISLLGLLIIAACGAAPGARAQYGGDPNRTYTDQMVLDSINRRRMEERLKSRSGAGKKAGTRKTAAKPVTRPLGTLHCSQDMYSDFGRDDVPGYTLEATFAPVGKSAGPPLVRWARLNGPKGVTTALFGRVPPGSYRVRVVAVLPDKTRRAVLLGTQVGSPTDPRGGNFAPSVAVTLREGKDMYGAPTVQGPTDLWFRPLEK